MVLKGHSIDVGGPMLLTRWLAGAAFASLAVPLAVALPTTAASAAGETCRGQAATIVGTAGTTITGTPGDDVIVTGGANRVEAGTGDDLVCTTNSASVSLFRVIAGPGDDVVDRTGDAPSQKAYIYLESGDDTFYGSSSNEYIETEGGADRVFGGGGYDRVRAGLAKQPVTAQIELPGSRGDVTLLGPPSAGFRLDAGPTGSVGLTVNHLPGAGTWTFDRGAGTIDYDGTPSGTFTGVSGFGFDSYFSGKRTPTNIRYLGTDAADHVGVVDGNLSGDLGGGDDSVGYCPDEQATGSSLDAGAGTDAINLFCDGTIDLSKQRVLGPDGRGKSSIVGFENASLPEDGTLIGDDGPNVLEHYGCYATIRGKGGDDVISTDDDNGETCDVRLGKVRLYGGAGDDVLTGITDHRVIMRGGPGTDIARGKGRGGGSAPAQALCHAERRVACRAF